MILIDAVYIHESGGKTLLEYFIKKLRNVSDDVQLVIDQRLSSDFVDSLKWDVTAIVASEKNRFEYYKTLNDKIDTVFCFANVPPSGIGKHVRVFVFFHNNLILSSLFDDSKFQLSAKLLFKLKFVYIFFKNRSRFNWIVQTNSMRIKLKRKLLISNSKIFLLPFFDNETFDSLSRNKGGSSFIYVADGVPQKNHIELLKAWEILFNFYNINIPLNLTVPEKFSEINRLISNFQQTGIAIQNHGRCKLEKVKELYLESRYLIFPSLSESFGLPLLEGINSGCKVLASDLEYVHDIIKPSAVFNPYKAEEIAKAVVNILNDGNLQDSEILVENEVVKLIQLLINKNV